MTVQPFTQEKDRQSKIRQITIERTGQKDLAFKGYEVARATTATPQNNTRYDAVTLYETAGFQFVLQQENITRWQGETSTSQADVIEIKDLEKHLFISAFEATVLEDENAIDPLFKELIENLPDDDIRFKQIKELIIERID